MSRVPIRISTLVSVNWLAEKITSRASNVRVLDTSWFLPMTKRSGRQEYFQTHIPTSQYFDIDECCDKQSQFDHMLPSPKEFEDYVGKLGISNNTHVVVYDNNDKFGLFSAQRVWWTFRVFGHDFVSILNGGFPKWLAEGHEHTEEVDKVPPVTFKATYHPHLVKSFEDVERNLKEKKFLVIDARAAGRFEGTSPEPRSGIKPGHVPGAVNVPFMDMLNPDTKLVKEPAELREVFQKANIDLSQPLASMCGSGVTACVLVLAAHLCGHEPMIPVFDGAWVEYYMRARHQDKEAVPL